MSSYQELMAILEIGILLFKCFPHIPSSAHLSLTYNLFTSTYLTEVNNNSLLGVYFILQDS